MDIKRKIYIKITATTLLVILAGVLLIPYLLESVKGTARAFKIQKGIFEYSLTRDSYLDSLRRAYLPLKNNIQVLRNSFLASGQEINFIQEIEKISAETNNIEEIRVLTPQEEGGFKSFGFQVVLYGALPNLLKFLANMENGKYQTAITDLSIDRMPISETLKYGDQEIIVEAGGIKSILNIRAYVMDNHKD